MRMSRISSFSSGPNVSFSLMQCGPLCLGLFTKAGFPRPDCIIDVSDELGAENKTWINKLKQLAKLTSFLKGTRHACHAGDNFICPTEISTLCCHLAQQCYSALLPKSVVHLMDPETWKLDLETWLINHRILYSFDVISFKKMLDVEMKGFGDGAGRWGPWLDLLLL